MLYFGTRDLWGKCVINEARPRWALLAPDVLRAPALQDRQVPPITSITRVTEAARYLFDDLRIEREAFERMDPTHLDLLAGGLRSRKVALCASLLRDLRTRT